MFGIFSQVQGWVKLKGDTDGTKIGNNGNSLFVIGKATGTPVLSDPALVVRPLPYEPQSYSVAAVGFIPPATAATDIFTITGSATKVVRIKEIRVSGSTTSGSAIKFNLSLIKRSTANTGGTSVAVTVVPNNSTNAAPTATARSYTVNATALGTSVGAIRADSTSVAASGIAGGVVIYDFSKNPIILRGVTEQLCVNLGGATITGPIFSVSAELAEV